MFARCATALSIFDLLLVIFLNAVAELFWCLETLLEFDEDLLEFVVLRLLP